MQVLHAKCEMSLRKEVKNVLPCRSDHIITQITSFVILTICGEIMQKLHPNEFQLNNLSITSNQIIQIIQKKQGTQSFMKGRQCANHALKAINHTDSNKPFKYINAMSIFRDMKVTFTEALSMNLSTNGNSQCY